MVIFRRVLFGALLLLGANYVTLQGMDPNPPMTLEQYKRVLATGDCPKIVKETRSLWPKDRTGFHIEFNRYGEFEVRGDVAAVNALEYRAALYDFVVQNILKSAISGDVTIDKAFEQIDQLAGECTVSVGFKSWNGILNNDVLGTPDQDLRNQVAVAMKLAICHAHSDDPATRGVNPTEYRGAADSLPRLIKWIRNNGEHPESVELTTWKMIVKVLWGVIIVGVCCTAWNWYSSNSKDEDCDKEDALDEHNSVQNNQINGENDEIT